MDKAHTLETRKYKTLKVVGCVEPPSVIHLF